MSIGHPAKKYGSTHISMKKHLGCHGGYPIITEPGITFEDNARKVAYDTIAKCKYFYKFITDFLKSHARL